MTSSDRPGLFRPIGEASLIEWFRESRWRAHVIGAARGVMSARRGAQTARTRPSIGVQWEAALELRGAAGRPIPPAGCVASFVPS